MIVVNIIGGLGNQLFQYALGRRLAQLNNTTLKLDITGFSTFYKLHKYSLSHFNVEENFATPDEVKKYRNFFSQAFVKVNRIAGNNFGAYYQQKYIKEQNNLFDQNILKAPSDTFMQGFWQTEKYFKEIAGTIRNEFTFKTPPSDANRKLADEILQNNAVSIHVRRTDYITDSASNQAHGTCDLNYYRNAINYIAKHIEAPHFYIFSDDMPWVKENLKFGFATTFIDFNNANTNYEDLRLMSLCKHNIIANSTFSWWGAWLNNYDKKIVIVPEKWFNDKNRSSVDLIPEDWNKLQ